MQPLISIVTVTFNAAEELIPTLQSVAEQSFEDYEHIIVDGGSTDRTPSIAEQFDNPLIKVYSKPDEGIYHGMNRGLKYATGQYVIFLNAGDRFATPYTLALYANAAKKDADIIYGDTVIVNKGYEVLRPRHKDAPDILTFESYKDGMLVCHQAFMVRKELASKYDRRYKYSSDYDWCLRCIKASDAKKRVNLNEVTIHYLDCGTTERHKKASLLERFCIMTHHFGLISTLQSHYRFITRS